MSHYTTVFGSLKKFEKGTLSIINDDPRHYCYSNVFEVASKARPWQKIAVAKNLEYVIETIRAEGTSDWFAAGHDEFVVVLDGEVTVSFIELSDGGAVPTGKDGTVKLAGTPAGRTMGRTGGRVHIGPA
ncbi:MAG: hydroxyquinol 1,2-dioxygenase [Betaproteobacteria bacterium]